MKVAPDKLAALRAAISAVYYGYRWTCPTLDAAEQARLWEAVRDAAGFTPGDTKKLEAKP